MYSKYLTLHFNTHWDEMSKTNLFIRLENTDKSTVNFDESVEMRQQYYVQGTHKSSF